MAVIRVQKSKDYTVMSNHHLREKDMSLKAKGLLSMMLSLPDGWDYSVEGLVAICKEEKTSIQGALKELEQFGYLVRTRVKNEKGQFEYLYDIFEKPQSEKPRTDFPCTDNQPQLNTKELNTNNNNILRQSQIDYDAFLKMYHESCPSLPQVKKLNDKRKDKIRKRLKVYTIKDYDECFKKAEQSDFLCGRSGKWKASFDWFIENDNNILKVLEGNYANRDGGKIEIDNNFRGEMHDIVFGQY